MPQKHNGPAGSPVGRVADVLLGGEHQQHSRPSFGCHHFTRLVCEAFKRLRLRRAPDANTGPPLISQQRLDELERLLDAALASRTGRQA
jgi:hypothetical protein